MAGVTRDYLDLEFQGSDRVFMPVDQLAKISRYVGAGGERPALSKLGGTRWDTMKARARRAAQELAGELLNLYAERRHRRGFGFPPDTDWLHDFETAFAYTETRDQREARDAVSVSPSNGSRGDREHGQALLLGQDLARGRRRPARRPPRRRCRRSAWPCRRRPRG